MAAAAIGSCWASGSWAIVWESGTWANASVPSTVIIANAGGGPDGGWLPFNKGKAKRFNETEWRRQQMAKPAIPPALPAGPPPELRAFVRMLDLIDS